jgi:hypothetical protein
VETPHDMMVHMLSSAEVSDESVEPLREHVSASDSPIPTSLAETNIIEGSLDRKPLDISAQITTNTELPPSVQRESHKCRGDTQ